MSWAYAGDVREYKERPDLMLIEGTQLDMLRTKYEVPKQEFYYTHCYVKRVPDEEDILYCSKSTDDDDIMWAWADDKKVAKEVWED